MRGLMRWGALATLFFATLASAQDHPRPESLGVPRPQAPIVVPAPSAPSPAGARALTKADIDSWLDGYMPYALRSGDIPGAVVVVVKDGAVLTARGFGFSDVASRRPVDPDRTLFRPGSISKLFTWTAVMQLVERGKLNLDTDVNAYLDFKIPPYRGKPITLRQIMTHTAGFEETAKGIVYLDPKYNLALRDYLMRRMPARIFAPGTTPAYSNYATALAGYIIERASGQSYDDYIAAHIFAPLGMRNSTTRQPLPAILARQMATGYPHPGQAAGFEYVGPGPAGNLSASGGDMARFMIAHLNGGTGILSPATARMMHDSPLGRIDRASLLPPLSRMQLGFFETNLNGREVIGHLGDTEAFHSALHLFMNEKAGLYVSVNGIGKEGAAGTLRGALFQDFADRYFPNVAPADGRVDPRTAAHHAQMMAGQWWTSRRLDTNFLSLLSLFGQTQVTVGPKGELTIPSLVGANGRPRQWVEIAPFLWRDRDGHDRLAARIVDGKVVRWSFDFLSPFMVFDRVPAGMSSAWIVPALGIAVVILLLTVLHWPVAWFVRRRYATPIRLEGHALRADRATRLILALVLALVAGWAVTIVSMLGSPDAAAGGADTLLWVLQDASAVLFVGAVGFSVWNTWLNWRDQRRWSARIWSLLILLSTLVLLYVAIRFGLLAMTVEF